MTLTVNTINELRPTDEQPKSAPPEAPSPRAIPFPVVGIGASAGGLPALIGEGNITGALIVVIDVDRL